MPRTENSASRVVPSRPEQWIRPRFNLGGLVGYMKGRLWQTHLSRNGNKMCRICLGREFWCGIQGIYRSLEGDMGCVQTTNARLE